MSRVDFKVVYILAKKVVDMSIKKVDVPDRLQGCQNWNQKG
jgi:hypothetical protein